MAQRTRVALVFGGTSSEHDVSCLTAGGVSRAIDPELFDLVGIGITPTGRWVQVSPDEMRAMEVTQGRLPRLDDTRPEAVLLAGADGPRIATRQGDSLIDAQSFDVAFALLHGPFGEDGTIQGLFELYGVPYVGSGVAASAIGMDKDLMKRTLSASGLPGCRFVAISDLQWRSDPQRCLDRVADLTFPVFVKPARGGSSVGISRVTEPSELAAAIEDARGHDPKVVIEEGFVGAREIELAVLGGRGGAAPRVSLPGEVIMSDPESFYDYGAKYLPEEQVRLQIPAEVDDDLLARLRSVASRTFEALGSEGLARVDLFVAADHRIYVNEINTMPGFTRLSMFPMLWAATGLSYTDLITDLIEQALERRTGLR